MAASFTERSVFVDQSLYFGLDDSATAGIFSALTPPGQAPYVLFTPDAAAVTAAFGAGVSYPLIVDFPGSGNSYPATARNHHCTAATGCIAQKLGFGTTDNMIGGGQAPNANWPTMVAMPQESNGWTGPGIQRDGRAMHLIVKAIVDDLCASFPIDRQRIISIGESAGTTRQLESIYARWRWPDHFSIDWSAAICFASALSGMGSSFRNDLPEMEQNENSTNQTVPRIAQGFAAMNSPQVMCPMWWFNSDGDFQNFLSSDVMNLFAGGPDYGVEMGGTAQFNKLRISGPSGWFRYLVYSGTSQPGHAGTWDSALANNVMSGPINRSDPLWVWAFEKKFRPKYQNRVPAIGTTVFDFAPAAPQAGGAFGNARRRRTRLSRGHK